jgi:hypothetical protein
MFWVESGFKDEYTPEVLEKSSTPSTYILTKLLAEYTPTT